MVLKISSPVFSDGEPIPPKYTCEGSNISPPLDWDTSKLSISDNGSIALICDDPDAPGGTWIHWVIFNLPPEISSLPEMVMPREELENGALQGSNSWGNIGYSGPCPPSGTHRYYFKVYALDVKLNLSSGVTKEEVLRAMEGHILDEGQLMGTYTRR
ncbi:MAG: YbhB/YbcL family Raf kinase inhibitor-like protein [Euryarchaeota archaeon]|jgi:Raf kinase inhibitor-like YbhB/YbcL family protein|uniref:YbhB/YbcL family Raf kinase inhibitor-like protein n=1 Tax=Methanobacterium sp. MZD130B TaxID=3394378 RepID=UPI00175B78EF|nr:YbhB/YbcL family Raf kinase inhibitor-like protein [Euryarchaeota archaeon]HHT18307.1 YbhB/YbcL family Raf kinase inhibitor-like protein [Methanobacterium sp.]